MVMIGDRPNTDVCFGRAAEIDTCLVLTGVVKSPQHFMDEWGQESNNHPHYMMDSFGKLE